MFSTYNIYAALAYFVRLINFLILIRVLLTWVNPNPHNPIVKLIHEVTEPILGPVRNIIYNKFGYSGMIDFSPMVAIFLVNFVYSIVVSALAFIL
ncbi:MAG: YggT family protein [Clostridiales bacterium]|nr:YggT family protein [Clostridiales bacterium]